MSDYVKFYNLYASMTFEQVILGSIKININYQFYVFREELFCDIKLQTDDGKKVYGHKVVLVSASPYFRAMFTSFTESDKDLVNIKELDSNILQLLVDYIYTGEIIVTEQNVLVCII